MKEVIKHIAKKGDSLKGFVNSPNPVILVIENQECLLYRVSKDKAEVLYRNYDKAGGWPTEALLNIKNYHLNSLELKTPPLGYVDFSSGHNISLNKAGIIYKGNDKRLKLTEKLHKEYTGETW